MIIREERIGNQRLILGDCLAVMPTLGRFDAVVTDPPYGIEFSRGAGGGGFGRKVHYHSTPDTLPIIKGDDRPFDPEPILALGVPTIMWGANHYADKLPTSARWLIWDKRRGTAVNDFADCEMAWTNLPGPARVLPHMWNGGLRDSEQGIPRVHKTQKAIVVMEWCLGFLPDAQDHP
jgi:site-specific DNA-methyltransferase (adenine-specific)